LSRSRPAALIGPNGEPLFAHGELARRLVAGPRAAGIAERGMRLAISLRMAQLVTLARLSIRERLFERALEEATDDARENTLVDDPATHTQTLVEAGQVLGSEIARTILTYAREYDADDDNQAVLRDARMFVAGLATELAAFATKAR
jgi:hypothetical protein